MFVDLRTKLERAGICQRCEHYQRSTRQCKECGCFVNFKVILENSSCPIGKWYEIKQANSDPKVNIPE